MTLFIVAAVSSSHAVASDFTEHFTFTKPPVAVPTFSFEDAQGQNIDLKSFKGRYVLLNIWATWCGPCAREMPTLDALGPKLAADIGVNAPTKPVTISTKIEMNSPRLDIIALSEDHEGVDAAKGFYKRHNLNNLKVYADTGGSVPNILQIHGLPTTVLIDPNGMEIGRIEGEANWTDPATIAFLEGQMKPAGK